MEKTIRGAFNSVITRSLIYGVSPFDMEYVLQQLEKKSCADQKVLEELWSEEWGKKANRYSTYGKAAKEQGNLCSASEFYMMTARCYYACYLMESEQIAGKREIYKKLERYYQAALSCASNRFEKVSIPMMDKKVLPGYLHLPKEDTFPAPYPCVTIFAGMGSCKEELEIMARPLIARGVAVLVLDQPGTGSSLFDFDVKTGGAALELGFDQTMEYLTNHKLIDETRLGTYGLGMGASYAYRMAAKHKEIKSCANVCPVFITMLEEDIMPDWVKDGVWARYQRQQGSKDVFIDSMNILEQGSVEADYLAVYSGYDSWMSLEKTKYLLEKTSGETEEIIISEAPAYATKESVIPAMPVGEQTHWVKIKVADWFVSHLNRQEEDGE